MADIDRDIAEQILCANGLRASGLGLRFDRVALSLLASLRAFVDETAPDGVTVLAAVTAPVRLAAKTRDVLKQDIGELVAANAPTEDRCGVVHGNGARLRRVEASPGPSFIGFVHNPGTPPERLLDLAEQWLRGQAQR